MSAEQFLKIVKRLEWSDKRNADAGIIAITEESVELAEEIHDEILSRSKRIISFDWTHPSIPVQLQASIELFSVEPDTHYILHWVEEMHLAVIARYSSSYTTFSFDQLFIDLMSDNGTGYNSEILPLCSLPVTISNHMPHRLSFSAIEEGLMGFLTFCEEEGLDPWEDVVEKTQMAPPTPPTIAADDLGLWEDDNPKRQLLKAYMERCCPRPLFIVPPLPGGDSLTTADGRPLNAVERLGRYVSQEATEEFVLRFLDETHWESSEAQISALRAKPVGVDHSNTLVKLIFEECRRRHGSTQKDIQ
jgi:hypothetical protein